MVSHRLINIQISGRRSIKACQQLVHHDQQLHLFRLLDKLFFDLFFKCFWVFSTQHLHVDFVLFHRLGLAIITYGFSANIAHRRFVRSHDGALPLQLGLLEQFIEFARLIDTTSHQHGITPPIVQARFCLHIKNNIRYNLSQASFGTEHLLQITPALFQLSFCHTGQPARFCLKPSVDPILLDNILLYFTSLIAQIQNHFIPHCFIKLVAMDVRAKYLQTGLLILFHQWSTGEADKGGIRQNGFHRFVEFAGLGTVAFIHKDIEIAFGRKVFRQ